MATTSLESRVTGTETSIKYLKSDLSKTKLNLAEVEEKSNTLENDVKENKAKIKNNTSRIEDLEKAQENTNVDMRLMKTSQSNINEDIVDLAKHIEDVDENTTNLEKKHTEDLTEVKDELVNLYEGIIRVEDKIEENKNNCNCNSHDHHHHHKPDHTCNCPYCEGSEEKEEPVIPSTASIMDKLVAKYLKEHINDLFCTIIPRHDISTNWTLNDPILTLGEYGVEDDTHRIKRGDGTSKWSELPYETFGIDKLVPTSASDVSYSNVETGLEKNNVQEMLDFLVETDVAFSKKLDKKEDIGNRRTDLDNEDNDHYPTTKAVVDYVTDRLKNIDIGGGGVSLPDSPDETKNFILHNNKGTLEWIEEAIKNGVEIIFWNRSTDTENLEFWKNIIDTSKTKDLIVVSIKSSSFYIITTNTFKEESIEHDPILGDEGFIYLPSANYNSNTVNTNKSTGVSNYTIMRNSLSFTYDASNVLESVSETGGGATISYLPTGAGLQNITAFIPTEDYQPTTKKYVDDKFNSVSGGIDVSALQQKVDDQQNEIDTLKSSLKALQDKFDSLIDLNEEEF